MLSKCQKCEYFHVDLCAVNPSYRLMEDKLRSRISDAELENFEFGILPCNDWERSQKLEPVSLEVTLTRLEWEQVIRNPHNLPLEFAPQIRSALGEPEEIRMIPVQSSNIAAIGYDPRDRILRVDFMSGGRYQYFAVPSQIFEDFQSAHSKGRFLNTEIKGEFDYELLQ